MSNSEKDISRRTLRRKRRIRSQIIAYSVMAVIAILIIVGIGFGISALIGWVKENKQAAEQVISEQQENELQSGISDTIVTEETGSTESTEVEEGTPRDALDDMVDELIAQMTPEEKAAGVFLVSPEALTGVDVVVQAGDGTKSAMEQYSIGGIVYQTKNVKSTEQLQQMISNTSSYSKYPLFFAISEESGNGTLAGINELGIEQTQSAWELAASGDANSVYGVYSSIGSYMSILGFNMNFAPVADVLTNEGNQELQGRTFGSEPENAREMVAFATDALQQKNVSAVLMKFPGEGNIETGADGVAVTNKTLSELKDTEFLTFKSGIDAGADFVMVSHICAPMITGDTVPCSMSSVMLQDVLRDDLKFQGIIITDAMDQSIITGQYSSAEAAVNALNAGADMILRPENFEEAYQGVLAALESGSISEDRINDALHHIYRVKYKNEVEE